jgi:hypothetical protein
VDEVPRNVVRLLRDGGVPGRLTVKALRCASALPPVGRWSYAARLYWYHTLPRSTLAVERADVVRLLTRDDWRVQQAEGWPWFSLSRGKRRVCRWKLYVSPAPAELYECARRALPVLAAHDCVSIKVGRDVAAMLRPDRFIAYFADHRSLIDASTALLCTLTGFHGLGVPFTSPIADGGLLSWGVEPARPPNGKPTSWRQWVTSQLAWALFEHATRAGDSSDPVEFALQRLVTKGMDPGRFVMVAATADSARSRRRHA